MCFYGGGVVLCRVQEGCFAGVKSSALQGMILLLFNHSFAGETWGVPPWGLTNLIRCDISEVAKHHILGRNYSNYDNFFPIKAHRCSGRHGGYFSGRHGSLPLRVAPKAIQSPLVLRADTGVCPYACSPRLFKSPSLWEGRGGLFTARSPLPPYPPRTSRTPGPSGLL